MPVAGEAFSAKGSIWVKRSVMAADLTHPRRSTAHRHLRLKLGLESLASSRTERPWACVVQRCARVDSALGLVGHEGAGDYGAVHLIHPRWPGRRLQPEYVPSNIRPQLFTRDQTLCCAFD